MPTTQRQTVIDLAKENGWERVATPNFDVFRRTRGGDDTEIEVFYYSTGRVQGAHWHNETQGTYGGVPSPARRMESITGWLSAPGE